MSSIQHFSHTHPLKKNFNNVNDFICDGCGVEGSGKKYRCESCDYDLHEYCAICPFTLQIFMHPQHELSLCDRKDQSTWQNGRFCDICNDSFEGLFYRCGICDFDVHPYCTKLPQHVKHNIHPAHNLEFLPYRQGITACEICHDPIQSWRYGCELCRLNIHLGCLLNILETSPSDQTEASSTRSDGDVICKDCGSKNSVKRAQCKQCRDLKWERRTKRLERVNTVLEVVMEFLG